MNVGGIKSGDIYHLFCNWTTPPKNKFHAFLQQGYYFLINSKYSCESVELKESDYPSILTHNSYLSCRLYRYDTAKVINERDRRGSLIAETIKELIETIPKEETLSPDNQDMIIGFLSELLTEIEKKI